VRQLNIEHHARTSDDRQSADGLGGMVRAFRAAWVKNMSAFNGRCTSVVLFGHTQAWQTLINDQRGSQ
jgi:hypothetical protein